MNGTFVIQHDHAAADLSDLEAQVKRSHKDIRKHVLWKISDSGAYIEKLGIILISFKPMLARGHDDVVRGVSGQYVGPDDCNKLIGGETCQIIN